MQLAKKIVNYLENVPLSLGSWVFSFGAVTSTRLYLEYIFFSNQPRSFEGLFGAILHTLLFFLISYLLLFFFLRLFSKKEIQKTLNVLLWGQWIILLPPVIDKIIFKDKYFFSFYIFDSPSGILSRFFHFFGANPDFGITYGTRFEVALVSLLLFVYVYIKKEKFWQGLLAFFGGYTVLFFLGCFPSFIAFVFKPFLAGDAHIQASTLAKIFLSPLNIFSQKSTDFSTSLHFKMALIYGPLLFVETAIFFWLFSKNKFISLLKNVRYPQMIFNWGIFFIGLALGGFYFRQNLALNFFSFLAVLNLAISIFCAWMFSVVMNDLNDVQIDKITNIDRPLINKTISVAEYQDVALVFLLFSLLFSLVVGWPFFLFLSAYHFLTMVYSCYPFRLKRLFLISTLLASTASLIFFFMGFSLVAAKEGISRIPWRAVGLLFVAYGLVLPLKDLKDYEGDKADKVITLPVLLGIENARLFLAAMLFICYFLSAYAINEKKAILPALFFASTSYILVSNRKINPRKLIWYVLALVFFYGLILVKLSFF